jgi:hypothetical protein
MGSRSTKIHPTNDIKKENKINARRIHICMCSETTECWIIPRKSGWTIADLKQKLAESIGIPANEQVLIYRVQEVFRPLEDQTNLALFWDKKLLLQRSIGGGRARPVQRS